MAKLSLEDRKTRLLGHLYHRLLEDSDGDLYEWIDVLDALQDVLNENEGGLREWTITKDYRLIFK